MKSRYLVPTLTPKKVRPLVCVLAAANKAVSAVLLTERDGRQMPIHYVRDIHAFVDSKLLASQVEGSYEAKGERMIKYQEKVLELAGAFNKFRITHIPRAENRKADALSKLAAV
ncbi:reverse transcriptase domain-containing protein [Tanacetum coccineum]|uniref:Reverse transcriptase domain-containing protein n=1 Tax=Tanacetum coccineum TaxID=301880 RepID=A0ABQ4ZDC0_9ASTR